MKKNRSKTIEMTYEIRDLGNWNYKDKDLPSVCTKPIVEIKLDEDVFVWKHEEILRLIEAYHKADVKSMKLISEGKAGSVSNWETPFLNKIKNFITKLEEKGSHNPEKVERFIKERGVQNNIK